MFSSLSKSTLIIILSSPILHENFNPFPFSRLRSFQALRMLSSCNEFSVSVYGGFSGDNLSEHSSSAVIATNNDILRQILLFLPVKSLLVFKSVSRQWLSLISDPYFIHNHCRQNRPLIPGFFLDKVSFYDDPELEFVFLNGKSTTVPFKSLEFVNNPSSMKIEQSCNGLLCCSSYDTIGNKPIYSIYNPTTTHCTILPESQNREKGSTTFGSQSRKDCTVSICSISLAFDPRKSCHYKAICILNNKTKFNRIEIYSSETASWKLSGDVFPSFDDLFFKSGVFWNGSLHWISFNSSVYFDVDQELIRKMPMSPISDILEKRIGYFGEFRDHLHLIELHGPRTTRFDIYEMENDYSRWTAKYHVDIETITIAYPDMVRPYFDFTDFYCFDFYLLLMIEEEEEDLSSLVLQISDKVISYNLKEMTFKEIHDISPSSHVAEDLAHYARFQAYQYIETFACV